MRYWIMIGLMAFVLSAMSTGCDNEGAAEKAGKKMDKQTEQTGDTMQEKGKQMKDKAQGN